MCVCWGGGGARCLNLVHQHNPAVLGPQVELLAVHVHQVLGQALPAIPVLRKQHSLAHLGRTHHRHRHRHRPRPRPALLRLRLRRCRHRCRHRPGVVSPKLFRRRLHLRLER